MKRITAIAFLTLASTLGLGSAFAQMQPRGVHATVPFDFAVGNKVLPAGTYTIARAKDGIIQIQNSKGLLVAMTLASDNGSQSKGCSLSFDRRNSQYFMRQVLCQSAAISISLPASNLEKKIPLEVATRHDSDGQVLLAAN